MENKDIKYLKKFYGEKFAYFCRSNFPTALEVEGLLPEIIEGKFAHTKSLYEDIIKGKNKINSFKSYIHSQVRAQVKDKIFTTKTPEELMSEAGYILHPECKTHEDIMSFEKYYAEDEELCTFFGNRLDTCRVWFATKKDVDKIKREDFTHPERQDRYGTSVISIQFTRNAPVSLSIKNRYNHSVVNPDATFSNDLENIIAGLSSAFEQTYNIDFSKIRTEELYLEGYVPDKSGKLYRLNVDTGIEQYCENNVIIDRDCRAVTLDKSRYILIDELTVDLQLKNIFSDTKSGKEFINSLGKIKDIKLTKNEDGNKVVVVIPTIGEEIKITINKNNAIIGIENNNVTEVGDNFLVYNKTLKFLKMDNLQFVGNDFLKRNLSLETLSLGNLIECGKNFLYSNKILKEINAEKLENVGRGFLTENHGLVTLKLNNLKTVGDYFLEDNRVLENLELNNLETCGDAFMFRNTGLKQLNLPKLKTVNSHFLAMNETIKHVSLPSLKIIGNEFLTSNLSLEEMELENVTIIGSHFLYNNEILTKASFPNAKIIGNGFLLSNLCLEEINLDSCQKIHPGFLLLNDTLKTLKLKNVTDIFPSFMVTNKSLEDLYIPKLKRCNLETFLNKNSNNNIILLKQALKKNRRINTNCKTL